MKISTRKFIVSFYILVSMMFNSVTSVAQTESLVANVDRTEISFDETLQLSITYQGKKQNHRPDTQELETHFDILSSNQSSRVQYVNGAVNSSTQWVYTLGPKKTGMLLVPSFKIDNNFSEAIEIKVSTSNIHQPRSKQNVFIETTLNKDQVYVQEQIILTQRLFISSSVSADQLDPESLSLDKVVLEELPSTKYSKTLHGVTFYVFEYSHAIFPQSSGELRIPSLAWNLRVSENSRQNYLGSRFGNYRVKRLRTQEKVIQVKPQPASYPTNYPWLPAKNISLNDRWSNEAKRFEIGEPITRKIAVEASGLTSSQLPQFINDANTNGVKFYIDQAQLEDEQKSNGVLGKRIESAAIVVTKAGQITIPGARIPWWNTEKDSLEYLDIPEKIVEVIQTPGQTDNTSTYVSKGFETTNGTLSNTQFVDSDSEGIWKTTGIASIITNILLIFFIVFLALKNGSQAKTSKTQANQTETGEQSTKAQWRKLSTALLNRDFQRARNNILAWQKRIDIEHYTSIEETIRKHSSQPLRQALSMLDSALYAKKHFDPNIDQLISLLKTYNAQIKNAETTGLQNSPGLAPLHPG